MFVGEFCPQTVSAKTVVRRRHRRRKLQTIQPVEPYATLIGTGDLSIKPRSKMKSGYLDRTEDISGVSGTGEVAEFTISTNGQVVVFWKHGFSYFPSLAEAIKVHGHGGKTKFVILTDSEEEHCLGCHAKLDDEGCEFHDFGCPACLATVK